METMNPIIEEFQANKFNYCHALEVNDAYELECILCEIYDNYIKKYKIDVIIDFCESLSIYCLNDENEKEVYDFNISEFLQNL